MQKLLPLFLTAFCTLLTALEWDFRNGSLQGLRPMNFVVEEFLPGKGFHGISPEAAYLWTSEDFSINAEDYHYLIVEYQGDAERFPVFFRRPDLEMTEQTKLLCSERQGDLRIYDLNQNPEWRGVINCLRFDVVLLAAGPEVTVRSIHLLKEIPTTVDGVQVPNGVFLQSGNGWSGDAEFNFLRAVIAPGGTIEAPLTETTVIGPYLLDWDASGELRGSLEYTDLLGNNLGSEEVGPAPYTKILPPTLTAYAQIRLHNPGTIPVTLRRLSLVPITYEKTAKSAHRDFLDGRSQGFGKGLGRTLQGSWIWNEQVGTSPNANVLFEKNFTLDNYDDLVSAEFCLTADNALTASVNGTPLKLLSANLWTNPDTLDIKELLHNGVNTLRLWVFNVDDAGGVLADLTLTYADETQAHIVTDETWHSQPLEDASAEEWLTLPVTQSVQVLGPNGIKPWDLLEPRAVNTIQTTLEGLDLPAAPPADGLWSPKSAHLVSLGKGTQYNPADLDVRLQDDTHDFLILNTQIPAGVLNDAPEFPLQLASADLSLLPPGTYKATAYFGGWGIPISGNNTLTVEATPTNSPEDALPQVSLDLLNPVPRIVVNGTERLSAMQYLIDLGSGEINLREIQNAADSGLAGLWIHYRLSVDKNGKIYFPPLDDICTSVLLRNPSLHIGLIPNLDPMGSFSMLPLIESNPDCLVTTADGEHKVRNYSDIPQTSPSMASDTWLRIADSLLEQIIEHVGKMPYGRHVVAVLPSSGITWEWMYWGSQKETEFVDYSVPFRQAFARFAQQKYGTIENVNRAWKTSLGSFQEIIDTNALPSPNERRDHGSGLFLRLPAESQMVMDFNRCTAKVVSDAILHLCSTVKKSSCGRLLTGVYYGYLNEITDGSFAHNSGHWALKEVLDSPVIDILMAPSTYKARSTGDPSGFMHPAESVRQAGKLLINESDIRTLHSGTTNYGGVKTLRESAALLIRELSACLTHNASMRFLDFNLGWVFRDPRLAQVTALLVETEKAIEGSVLPAVDPAEAMAILVSQDAMERITFDSWAHIYAITNQRIENGHTGIAHANYVIPDLQKIPLEHKLWFFQNPLHLSDEDVTYIQEKILVPGNTVIFGMAIDPGRGFDHFSTALMEKLTGMQFLIDMEGSNTSQSLPTLTPQGQERLGTDLPISGCGSFQIVPIFRPMKSDFTLALDGKGLPVLAESRVNGCRVIFSAMPPLRAAWLRALAVQTGLHCYDNNERDSIWGAGNLLGIHFAEGGERILKSLIKEGTATELITHKTYPIHQGQFTYQAEPISTAIFLME